MWFILALFSALFQVLRNVSMKQLGHALDETINVWGRFTFLLPFAAIGVAVEGIPVLAEDFWLYAVLFGVCQTLAVLSLSKALKVADISLVTALWKISLLVLVVWAYFALGETPSRLGLAGVLVSVGGVYLLNVHRARIAWWAPLAALVQDAGQRWTIVAGIGYAISVVLIKQLAVHSTPVFAVFMGYAMCSLLVTPYTIYRSGRHFAQLGRYWKSFVALGLTGTLATWFGTTAYTLTLSAYVEAVKQVEVLLAMAVGYLIFKEGPSIKLTWPGAVVIVAGLVLLKLGS